MHDCLVRVFLWISASCPSHPSCPILSCSLTLWSNFLSSWSMRDGLEFCGSCRGIAASSSHGAGRCAEGSEDSEKQISPGADPPPTLGLGCTIFGHWTRSPATLSAMGWVRSRGGCCTAARTPLLMMVLTLGGGMMAAIRPRSSSGVNKKEAVPSAQGFLWCRISSVGAAGPRSLAPSQRGHRAAGAQLRDGLGLWAWVLALLLLSGPKQFRPCCEGIELFSCRVNPSISVLIRLDLARPPR